MLWKPSPSDEATPGSVGDAYFNLAGSPFQADGTTPNPLYDPNYRRFDVEGYRIYRGRTDAPNALKLLAQFDYTGTLFQDYTVSSRWEIVPRNWAAMPTVRCISSCPRRASPAPCPMATPITGNLIQVKYGDRQPCVSGEINNIKADTAGHR